VDLANEDDPFTFRIRESCKPKLRNGATVIDVYCCCSEARTTIKCKAVKRIQIDEVSLTLTLHTIESKHNHEPNEDIKIKPLSEQVKVAIREQAAKHIAPGQIRQNLATQYPGKYIGTKAQIKYVCIIKKSIYRREMK